MRVLLVMTSRQVGGAELYVERLLPALIAETDTITTPIQLTVAMSDHPGLTALADQLARVAEVVRFPFDRLSRLPGVVRAVRRLAAGHDVIHINSNHPASRLGILMGFVLTGLRHRVVCVEHRATPVSDVDVPRALAWLLPTLFRWSRQRVARIVAVSQENRQTLIDYYRLPGDRIEVVYNGVDTHRFAAHVPDAMYLRRELGLRPDQPIILVLARLAPNKGHRYLVDAAPAILLRFPEAHFVFAGPADEGEEESLQRQIAAAGLGSHFSLLGPRTDVVEVLHGVDLFVLPSLAEGFALSVIEALAAGLPVVATAVGGATEIIEDGYNGLLVPPADPGALAAAVNRVLGMDAAGRARLGQRGRDSVQRFSTSVTATRMLAIYRSLQQGQAA